MVSITVFTFLIVLCIGLFIFLGRIYYRGLYENRVQEVARTIVDSVAESVRTSGAEIDGGYVPSSGNNPWYAYCIGNIQYSYKLNTQLTAEPVPGADFQSKEVFIASRQCDDDKKADPAGIRCVDQTIPLTTPCDTTNSILTDDPVDKTELLSEGLRLLEFSIKQVGDNQDFYRIRIKVAVGGDASDLPYDKAVFEYTNHPCTPGTDPEKPTPLYETDCVNGKDNKLSTDPGGTTSHDTDNGTWKEPDTSVNVIHDELHANWDINPAGLDSSGLVRSPPPPPAVIYRCQDSESFCSVIEIETKIFRRIL